ncbi:MULTISPECIES: metallopeptidase TldD-related protein [Butyricimonas]|uniref:metallopeptidase TldD-related protein n=1 Tax=Butyricimonas TaxID=574697 RepID=UPI0007FB55D5|nr:MULTISPECIES: metallopeptidase TldD-related protein [Butyricimonas]
MKRFILYIVFLFLLGSLSPVTAQTDKDNVIIKAMQDELQRSMEQLSLPKVQKPFFISYATGASRHFEIEATLGAITRSTEKPNQLVGSVKLLLGDYKENSDSRYLGRHTRVILSMEPDYDLLRQDYWLATDYAYKNASREWITKRSMQKRNVQTGEETRLPDLVQIEAREKIITPQVPFVYNRELWEDNLRALSAIFASYPELYNSSVQLSGTDMEVYLTTSEGSVVKQPVRIVTLHAEATTRTEDGMQIKDALGITARVPEELPSLAELKSRIEKFAEQLTALKKAETIDPYYCGPVLFEGSAAASILRENLLSQEGLFAYRTPQDPRTASQYKVNSIAPRMGLKIIDNRLTVKNYSTLGKYNNTPLYGAYEIDAEGVVPPQEVTLVENGILKNLLNGRVPTLNCENTTGSSRYIVSAREIAYKTAPGTIHVSARNAVKPETLKKNLLKIAKSEGLPHAYIVRKIAGNATRIYKVNVKDGSETLVRTGEIMPITLSHLRRLSAISNKENVANYLLDGEVMSSIIYPSALLLEDIEIKKAEVKKESEPALRFPLTIYFE